LESRKDKLNAKDSPYLTSCTFKDEFIGEDGVPAVGKVKMGFLFDVTERTVKGDRMRVTLGLLVLSALSFGFAEYLRNGNASAAFYLMAPRFWEFALGGIAALWFPWRQGALWKAVVLRGAGIVVILWATNSYRVDSAFPGVGALPPVLAAIAILAAPVAKRDPVLWLLSSRGANWLGLRSYSAYLWHWPLMVAALLFADRPSDELLLGMGLLGIVMGAVSYRLIERPTQSSALWIAPRRLLPLTMLAPSLVVAMGVLPAMWRSALPLAEFRSVLTMVDHEFTAYRATVSNSSDEAARGIQCSYDDVGKLPAETAQAALTECLTAHGQRPFTLVIGDSHGRDLFQTLRQAFPARTFVHLNQSACPPLAGHVKKFGITTCFAGLEAHLQTAIGAGAESIVLGSHWPDKPNAEFEETAALLKATGLPVIVSGAGPISRFEIPRLIAKGAADPLGETRLALPEPLVNSGRDAVAMETALKAWAEAQGWGFSSKYAAFCANSYCDVAERLPDGTLGLLFWDNQHFTLRGIAQFAEWLRDDPAFAAFR
ncbi:MAG: acyltransferase, partial [Rhodobacteraceae bacterium]|nr:acyltransferase [Paracoccaceae bacterium]